MYTFESYNNIFSIYNNNYKVNIKTNYQSNYRKKNVYNILITIFIYLGAVAEKDIKKDQQWTKDNLGKNITYSFFEESNDHLVGFY